MVKGSGRAGKEEEAVRLLRTGIELEKKGLRAFLDLARKTETPSGKNMFITLAGEEVDHMEYLEKQLDAITRGKGWRRFRVKESLVAELAPKVEGGGGKGSPSKAGDSEALQIALDHEDRAVKFYETLSRELEDPLARKVAGQLREMEDGHYLLLRAELDCINKTGFWFDVPEFMTEANY